VRAAFPDTTVGEVDDSWPDRWREFHHAIRIGPLWVGPPWEEPPPDALAVVIDPGRAFGTGAHPSTRLSLELLLDQPRGSLLDLGCGSGVISIAAAKLGFAPVAAVDVDEVAVEVTRENAAANGVELEARRLDVREEPLPPAGLAVANISLELVQAAGARLDPGSLITAGYLAADRPEPPGYTHVDRRERDGWAADLYRR
jgi:ribosomal protein L11 methyltransferase